MRPSVQKLDSVGNQIVVRVQSKSYFFSYETLIAVKEYRKKTIIGSSYRYSSTTMKYLGNFLGHGIAETDAKLRDFDYIYQKDL
jgi:hypothetical protein